LQALYNAKKRGKTMKPKKKPPLGADTLNAIEWLNSILPDTPQMRAIEEEEWTKYNLAIALIKAREAAGHTQSSLAVELGVQMGKNRLQPHPRDTSSNL
jgi:hypothetical protein